MSGGGDAKSGSQVDFDEKQQRTSLKKLVAWYEKNRRQLPWRETHDAYKIWVSEIMLQQTQVATVIDYYHRFLETFPSVSELADASEEDVLKMWSGLGYYRRARQLHAAAKVICEEHAGVFPQEFEEILGLPGIGRYTAGAIASFAYDQAAPILEANTIRLFSRLIGLRDVVTESKSQRSLWATAESWIQLSTLKSKAKVQLSPGQVNQALMELGSQICMPQAPACGSCPLANVCCAYKKGLQLEIPKAKPKQQFEQEDHVLVVLEDKGRFLLRQNEPGQWWEGLWDFPRMHTLAKARELHASKKTARVSVESEIMAQFGLDCEVKELMRTMKHGVTKYRITLYCFQAIAPKRIKLQELRGNWKWVASKNAEELVPLTSTASKLVRWLRKSAE